MRLLTIILCLVIFPCIIYGEQPIIFFTKQEAIALKKDIGKYPVFRNSFNEIKTEVDKWVGKDIDVPFPKDPAGGYTHDKHKSNYGLIFNSGILFNITGETKYATLVKEVLLKYAALNPQLKNHPHATSNSPGHIFWQALNDANWLVYTGMAYDLIYSSLTSSERKKIEEGAFKPEVDFITKDLKSWFDLIHNHGVWAAAGVGIAGIATHNDEWVKQALYGTEKNGKSGFLAQLDNLFSPDGYYTEGPYYVRYALLPFYLFGNALQNARPELKIFNYRDQVLKKALLAGMQQTNIDGAFFPLNDALKEKNYTTNELISAISIAWSVYGRDEGLLAAARKQGRVLLNKGGLSIAAALANQKNIPGYYPYRSVEFTDGAKGNEGGLTILRAGKDEKLTSLIYKYTSHGLSHGHFDKLNLVLYDKGKEILQDYGAVRFIGIEQKYGGRYLPENKTFAAQTIAHNTIVVDETSHFNGKENESEKYHPEKLFSSVGTGAVQAVSAIEEHAYQNVQLHRSLYMFKLTKGNTFIIDVFRTTANTDHQYDLPFQYNGQFINSNFKYQPFTVSQDLLGKKNGYQFYRKEAEAIASDSISQFTFLNGDSYYTISSLTEKDDKLIFARSGANDPDFNLRREPAYIIRKQGKDAMFLNVIEIHGSFDPIAEFSSGSYSSVQNIQLLKNDSEATIAELTINGRQLVFAQCNKDFDLKKNHSYRNGNININWTGPFSILYEGKILK